MHVALRVDASRVIGNGHVMRCLTLCEVLSSRGVQAVFLCREHEGNLCGLIEDRGFSVVRLPAHAGTMSPGDTSHEPELGCSQAQDAADVGRALETLLTPFDWLFVDHYALDWRWERQLRNQVGSIGVLDDLADRRHDCDLLFDQTLGRKEEDYTSLLPAGCRQLLGSRYALLRPEFAAQRTAAMTRMERTPRSLLINVGGTDPNNVTGWVLECLRSAVLPAGSTIDVVLAANAAHLRTLRTVVEGMPVPCKLHTGVSNMAAIIARADLAIGAAGTSAWERCCLGLPSVVITFADNQKLIARRLAEVGAIHHLGDYRDAQSLGQRLRGAVDRLMRDSAAITQMARAAFAVTDGQGANRVADWLVTGVNHGV